MEASGAVFLPAAGRRNGKDVLDVGDTGYYWSSSAYGRIAAWDLRFYSGYVSSDDAYDSYNGFSLRLVREIK